MYLLMFLGPCLTKHVLIINVITAFMMFIAFIVAFYCSTMQKYNRDVDGVYYMIVSNSRLTISKYQDLFVQVHLLLMHVHNHKRPIATAKSRQLKNNVSSVLIFYRKKLYKMFPLFNFAVKNYINVIFQHRNKHRR